MLQGLHASGDMAFFKDFEILENTAGHSHRKLYPDIITGGGGSGMDRFLLCVPYTLIHRGEGAVRLPPSAVVFALYFKNLQTSYLKLLDFSHVSVQQQRVHPIESKPNTNCLSSLFLSYLEAD